MFQRVIFSFLIFTTLSFGQAIPYPPTTNFSYCDNHPRVMALTPSQKSWGINFIESGNFKTPVEARAAARALVPPRDLTEEELCYVFAPRWGSDKKKTLVGGSVVRYLEKGQRVGGCRIELYGDLSYKSSAPNPIRWQNPSAGVGEDPEKRDILQTHIARDWPMKDCTKVPPECDTDFTPLRISNFMQNTTDVGLVAGDKTIIVQQWTCIKI